MNDRDNLRARIENTLAQAGARGKDKAQAVIDDLGLTVESDVVFHKVTQEGVWAKSEPQTRIVGKWEGQ